MSDPILPLAVWQSGTNENSIPANDNALRLEALSRLVISKVVTAQPVSPTDGAVYIIPSGATGTQWSTFDEDDLTIYRGGTWYAWAPVSGIVVNVAGSFEVFSSGWSSMGGGGGGTAPVVTESTTNLDATDANSGNYTRFTNPAAKTYTFDSAEVYTVGDEYHGRNVGGGDLTIFATSGFQLNPPAGGSLVVPQDGTFTVKIVGADEADVFGVTIP